MILHAGLKEKLLPARRTLGANLVLISASRLGREPPRRRSQMGVYRQLLLGFYLAPASEEGCQ